MKTFILAFLLAFQVAAKSNKPETLTKTKSETMSGTMTETMTETETETMTTYPCHQTDESDWTYNYDCVFDWHGQLPPDYWSQNYPECAGERQSPINIELAAVVSGMCEEAPVVGGFVFHSGECTMSDIKPKPSIKNWQFDFPEKDCGVSPMVETGGKTYKLLQFHFHSASEHTFGAGYYDAEVHMVHVNVDDDMDYMVIGTMLSVNSDYEDNYELNNYYSIALGEVTDGMGEMLIDPYAMLPPSPTYYSYLGSLTTPPCSEVVNWVVMEVPVLMSKTQMSFLRDTYAAIDFTLADPKGNNYRPVQPLNGRTIYRC